MNFNLENNGQYNKHFVCVDDNGEQYSITYNKARRDLSCGCRGGAMCSHKKAFKTTFKTWFDEVGE